MAIIDLTEDPRIALGIASTLGEGIGGLLRKNAQRKQFEEQKERERLSRQETIRVTGSDKSATEKRRELNELPNIVQDKLRVSLQNKAAEEALFGKTRDTKVTELKQALDSFKKTQRTSFGGEPETIPGLELVAEGLKTRINRLFTEIMAAQQPTTEQRPETIEPSEPVVSLRETIDQFQSNLALPGEQVGDELLSPSQRERARLPELKDIQLESLSNEVISDANVIASIKKHAQALEDGGVPRLEAQRRAIAEYETLKSLDTGILRKYPDIDVNTVFAQPKLALPGEQEDILTATNPTTGQRIISRDGGKTWQ